MSLMKLVCRVMKGIYINFCTFMALIYCLINKNVIPKTFFDHCSFKRIELFSANAIGLKESRALYDLINLRKFWESIVVGCKFKKEMLERKAAEKVECWDVEIPDIYHIPDLYNIWHKYVHNINYYCLFIY